MKTIGNEWIEMHGSIEHIIMVMHDHNLRKILVKKHFEIPTIHMHGDMNATTTQRRRQETNPGRIDHRSCKKSEEFRMLNNSELHLMDLTCNYDLLTCLLFKNGTF